MAFEAAIPSSGASNYIWDLKSSAGKIIPADTFLALIRHKLMPSRVTSLSTYYQIQEVLDRT